MATTEPLHTTTPARTTAGTVHRIGPRTVVSSLWLFAILNYLYCDVLSLHEPAYLRGVIAGSVNGIEFTQAFLLAASVLMTIPMTAVLVSRIARHGLARWYSIVAGAVMTAVQIGTLLMGSNTLHYIYFSIIEITTTAVITWYAATRWRVDA